MIKYFWLLVTAVLVLALNACTWDFETCEQGENKCNGKMLLTCSRDGNWVEALDCGKLQQFCDIEQGCSECISSDDCSEEKPICNAQMKICQDNDAECVIGEKKCDGNALSICDDLEGVFVNTICAESSFCDVSKGCIACRNSEDCTDTSKPVCNKTTKSCQAPDAVCAQGETKCKDDLSFNCTITGQWDVNGTACELGCNGIGTGCAECAVDDTKCEIDQAYVCSAGGWTSSGSSCKHGCNALGTACNVCAKEDSKCDSYGTHKVCNANQDGFKETSCLKSLNLLICDDKLGCIECRTNTDCQNKLGKPICNTNTHNCQSSPVVCIRGQNKCVGNKLSTCTTDGTWGIFPTFCTSTCNTLGTGCAVCTKDEIKCEGNVLQTCNDTLTDFDSRSCARDASICDPSKGCVGCTKNSDCESNNCDFKTSLCAKRCIAGDTACSRGTIYTCERDGTWKTGNHCLGLCNKSGTDCL